MPKKLRVELDVDAENAKRKVRRSLEEASATGGASVSGGVGGAADGAARSIKNLGDAAKSTNANMIGMAKAFAGIGVGLATSYAANYMKPGRARDTVEYGSAALIGAGTGAAIGKMAGPYGMAIGAAIGAVAGPAKTYMDKSGERRQLSEDFEKSEKIYSAAKAQLDRFTELTDVRKGGGTVASIAALRKGMENYEKSVETFVAEVRKELEKSSIDKDRIADLRRNIGFSRQMAERYKQAIEQIEAKGSGEFRGSTSATDSLGKIGGMMAVAASPAAEAESGSPVKTPGGSFAFSVPTKSYDTTRFGDPVGGFDAAMKTANEQIEKLEKEGNELLKSIDEHLKGKETGGTWQ